MTGHDLDLDLIAVRAAEHHEACGTNHRCQVCGEWSPCTVESLRAKLAAAEQERDTAKVNAVAVLRLLEVNRDALAAVREAARPLMKWVEFHTANYSGNPPNRRLAISYEAAPVTFADVQAFVAALAAAEQDEPTPEQP